MDYKIENEYLNDLMQKVMARNANEPEFHQAVSLSRSRFLRES